MVCKPHHRPWPVRTMHVFLCTSTHTTKHRVEMLKATPLLQQAVRMAKSGTCHCHYGRQAGTQRCTTQLDNSPNHPAQPHQPPRLLHTGGLALCTVCAYSSHSLMHVTGLRHFGGCHTGAGCCMGQREAPPGVQHDDADKAPSSSAKAGDGGAGCQWVLALVGALRAHYTAHVDLATPGSRQAAAELGLANNAMIFTRPQLPQEGGTVPTRALVHSCRSSSAAIPDQDPGSSPLSLLLYSQHSLSWDRAPQEGGKGPAVHTHTTTPAM
jgi:hypothetical protein